MLERVKAAETVEKIVVATSDWKEDDAIVEECHSEGVEVYRGDMDDVLGRYYGAAKSFGATVIARMTADCPLIDPAVIDRIIGLFLEGGYDFVANTAPPDGHTYPKGMDIEVFSFELLETTWKETNKPSDREHVTFYMWQNPDRFRLFRDELDRDLTAYRLVLDYPEDMELTRNVLENVYAANKNYNMWDLIAYLDEHPEIKNLNTNIVKNQGWQTAFDKDKQQGF
jgi:spore coat polysaccharide biosynthesis protein SpsF